MFGLPHALKSQYVLSISPVIRSHLEPMIASIISATKTFFMDIAYPGARAIIAWSTPYLLSGKELLVVQAKSGFSWIRANPSHLNFFLLGIIFTQAYLLSRKDRPHNSCQHST